MCFRRFDFCDLSAQLNVDSGRSLRHASAKPILHNCFHRVSRRADAIPKPAKAEISFVLAYLNVLVVTQRLKATPPPWPDPQMRRTKAYIV